MTALPQAQPRAERGPLPSRAALECAGRVHSGCEHRATRRQHASWPDESRSRQVSDRGNGAPGPPGVSAAFATNPYFFFDEKPGMTRRLGEGG